MNDSMEEVFKECVISLRPYLDQLVIAGGWVTYVYRKKYGIYSIQESLFTRDFDTIVPTTGLVETELSLNDSILESGFEYEFASLGSPPVVKYIKRLTEYGRAEIEFIADAAKGEEKVKTIGSVNAQALKYVGLLSEEPWKVELEEIGCEIEGFVLVPKPANYIFHKLLIAPKRRHSEKVAKDLYYVFYTFASFEDWRQEIIEGLQVLSCNYPVWRDRICEYVKENFSDIDSKGINAIVQQKPQMAFSSMTEDQFRQYALFLFRDIAACLRNG